MFLKACMNSFCSGAAHIIQLKSNEGVYLVCINVLVGVTCSTLFKVTSTSGPQVSQQTIAQSITMPLHLAVHMI